MKKTLLITLMGLCASQAFADNDERFSATFNACISRGEDTSSMRRCYDAEHTYQDARLNKIYKKIINNIPQSDQQLLRAAQREWIKYRDADYKLYSEFSSGTNMKFFSIARKVAQTAQRADELEILLDRVGIETNDTIDEPANASKYQWSGMINSKWPVDIKLEVKDGVAQGYIQYKNSENKTPIFLLGSADTNGKKTSIELNEMTPKGGVTGYISGDISSDGIFTGHWHSPFKIKETESGYDTTESKEYAIKLSKKEISLPDISWEKDLTQGGKYTYDYCEFCGSGTLEWSKKGNQAMVSIETNTAAPAFNMASVKESCDLQDGRFVCKLDSRCEFTITPYQQFAAIKYIDDKRECGFGMNASVDGAYLKVRK